MNNISQRKMLYKNQTIYFETKQLDCLGPICEKQSSEASRARKEGKG